MQETIHKRRYGAMGLGRKLVGVAMAAGAVAGAVGSRPVQAETGVLPDRIVLGQSVGLTGQLSAVAAGCVQGARAYFAHINARGGVHGRRIELVARDDGYEASAALDNVTKLMHEDKVFALFGHVGWPGIEASLPAITQARMPFLFPCTGAPILYSGFNRYVFTLRASYAQEYRHLLNMFGRIGIARVALVYQKDMFGERLLGEMAEQASYPALVVSYTAVDLNSNFAALSRRLADERPDAILLASGDPLVNAAVVRGLLALGYHGRFFGASVVGQRALLESLGEAAHGMVIAQIVPSPWQVSMPLVADYRRLMQQHGVSEFSFASMEGFIAARLVVEGLRRAGRQPTREKLIDALESINEHNFAHRGYPVSFSPNRHCGSDFVDTSMVAGAAFLN